MWSTIVGSSLWDEDDSVIKIFLTMMALKDADDVYRGDAYQLGKDSRKGEREALRAWVVLSGPDTKKETPQANEGRRIKAVEGGWLILNAPKYRNQVKEEMKRRRNAKAQKAWRERQAAKGNGKALPGEEAAQRTDGRGAEAIAAESVARFAALPAQLSTKEPEAVPVLEGAVPAVPPLEGATELDQFKAAEKAAMGLGEAAPEHEEDFAEEGGE